MNELHDLLDREASRISGSPRALGKVLDRVRRRQVARRIGTITVSLAVAALAIGTFVRTFDRSMQQPADGITTQTVGSLRLAWSAGLPWSISSDSLPLTATDGQTVFISSRSRLYAFPARCANDGGDCPPLWVAELGGQADDLAVADGQVVALAGDRLLSYAALCQVRRTTCQPTWTATVRRDLRFGAGVDIQADPAFAIVTTVWNDTELITGVSLDCGTNGSSCQPSFDFPADTPLDSGGDGHAVMASDGKWVIADGSSTVQAFPVTCTPRTADCVSSWSWTAPDGSGASLLGVDQGLVFVTLTSRAHHPDYTTLAFPTSCGSPCLPVWSTVGTGFVSRGYLYTAEKGFNNGANHSWGRITVFSTQCIGGSSCPPVWVADDHDARGIGFVDGSAGALSIGLGDSVLHSFPATCAGATTPCMPAVIHTGFPSGYPPFVLIGNDVLFASSYFYESGGSVSAYAADCGSDQPCPLLWSHRFGTDEYLAGPVLASPSNTSIFIVTTDKTGARLYAFAPGTIQPNGS